MKDERKGEGKKRKEEREKVNYRDEKFKHFAAIDSSRFIHNSGRSLYQGIDL
jgi:hypothetical protein